MIAVKNMRDITQVTHFPDEWVEDPMEGDLAYVTAYVGAMAGRADEFWAWNTIPEIVEDFWDDRGQFAECLAGHPVGDAIFWGWKGVSPRTDANLAAEAITGVMGAFM